MENASKALIIAGAILLSISIIGIGMYVFQQASDAMSGANMDREKIAAYNGDFERYGDLQSGTQVRALCDLVRTHNSAAKNDASQKIAVIEGSAEAITTPPAEGDTSTTPAGINAIKRTKQQSKLYNVDFGYDAQTGFIVAVGITEAP